MKLLPRFRSPLVGLLLFSALLIASIRAQSAPTLLATTDPPIVVRSVKVVNGYTGPAVEILSSSPLVPVISTLDNPSRLVIDLLNAELPAAVLSGNNGRIDVPSGEIRRVRINRYQNAPPVTRVVVDLLKPVGHTWDAAGNRLMVRLHPASDMRAKPPSVPAFTQGIQPVAVPLSPGSSGALVLAGSHPAAGSSVTAGSETSVLRLERGGEVLVCPGTTVSVTSSQKGNALMLAMNIGSLEAHYSLDASADSILTPDFRILLAGPGEFHYAVSADSRGNTCIRALPGNTASVIVSELLGEGNYQVKPTEQIVFRSGRLNLVDTAVPASCGCPPPDIPMLRASAAGSDGELSSSASMKLAQPGEQVRPETRGELPPETAALPLSNPNDVHVQVEAPFIFRAEDLRTDNRQVPKPVVIGEVDLPPVRELPRPASFEIEVLPPPQASARPAHHGVFAKIKGFFAGIFS